MDDEKFAPFEQEPSACPFVALEDDRDRRSDAPDYRHRCFASPQPEPRAFPHQERYCLSRGFVGCPIFLDWAHRESASVVPSRRSRMASAGTATGSGSGGGPAAGAAAGSGAAGLAGGLGAAGSGAAGAAAVSGGAGSQRDAFGTDVNETPEHEDVAAPAFLAGRGRPPSAATEDADTVPDPDEGLWGHTEQRRPGRPGPVTATARPNRNRPDWEPVTREERYPRIRQRSSLSSLLQPLLIGVVVVGALALAFFLLPGLLPKAGPAAKPTPTHAAQATPTPVPTVTATPAPTFQVYTIKNGDTMTSIAAKFNVSIDLLKAANPQIKSVDQIAAGDVLNIPWPGWAPTEAAATPTPQATQSKKP